MTGKSVEQAVASAKKQQRLTDFIRRVGGFPRSAEEHAELQSLLAAASEEHPISIGRSECSNKPQQ